ncbi:MazG nucleotide pyrophosphohydrolase domain-containing protein [Nocardioides zeae]
MDATAPAHASDPTTGHALVELVGVMDRLRRECPWKAGQTHRSLARYLLEETHEVLEALDTDDPALLREELGDLLLQVYFHAAIAAERSDATAFTVDDVAADLTAKLVRRNPHVFAPAGADGDAPLDAAAVNEAWEAVKATEKTRTDPTDGLPRRCPRCSGRTRCSTGRRGPVRRWTWPPRRVRRRPGRDRRPPARARRRGARGRRRPRAGAARRRAGAALMTPRPVGPVRRLLPAPA